MNADISHQDNGLLELTPRGTWSFEVLNPELRAAPIWNNGLIGMTSIRYEVVSNAAIQMPTYVSVIELHGKYG